MQNKIAPYGKYYDELSVGERYRSRGRTITEADIVNWCTSTGDMYVLHTNEEYARTTMFKQRIAPGFMIHAFLLGLSLPPNTETIVANYGAGPARFTAPVFIGDTIHLEQEVVAKADRPSGKDGLVTTRLDAVNQHGKLCLTSTLMLVMLIKPTENAE